MRDMTAEILKAKAVAEKIFKSAGIDMCTTSGVDGWGEHDNLSLHFDGDAIDIRTKENHPGGGGLPGGSRGKLADKLAKMIRAELGADYFVDLESTHLHIQYSPVDSNGNRKFRRAPPEALASRMNSVRQQAVSRWHAALKNTRPGVAEAARKKIQKFESLEKRMQAVGLPNAEVPWRWHYDAMSPDTNLAERAIKELENYELGYFKSNDPAKQAKESRVSQEERFSRLSIGEPDPILFELKEKKN